MTAIDRDASVLALIPHHRCEEWLGDALESLLDQTRPVDGIAVIDDASPDLHALIRIADRYPEVTFLRADRNVGPYALIQHTIDDTGYDAYLFQDADDWSAPDRLASLLTTAERTGAELVGTWELRVLCDAGEVMPVSYPEDASAVLAADPTAFALLHPTSLVARTLVDRVGGYSTGMRFSGDAEFLWRAAPVARIANATRYCYHRRKRAGSLTTDPATSLQSSARLELHERLRAAAHRRHEAVAAGASVDLTPYASAADPVVIDHVAGPALRHASCAAVTA